MAIPPRGAAGVRLALAQGRVALGAVSDSGEGLANALERFLAVSCEELVARIER